MLGAMSIVVTMLMPVRVTMPRFRRHGLRMGMLMMDIVSVLMFVLDRVMGMLMLVSLGKMEPCAQSH